MMDDFDKFIVGGKIVCSSEYVKISHALAERMKEKYVETFLH
jgi:hypothetical protein